MQFISTDLFVSDFDRSHRLIVLMSVKLLFGEMFVMCELLRLDKISLILDSIV